GGRSSQNQSQIDPAELAAFAGEYQKEFGEVPNLNSPQDQQFFMAWKQKQVEGKQQRAISTTTQKTPSADSFTAQQLREVRRLAK
ncbi:TPA: hypothetical protein PXN07_004386, partial [Yersinia enterocolitica]|nr:hypothetical protein [Yersinia enterocolitica]